MASPAQYVVVATNGLTGAPHYFTKSDTRKDGYEIVKASCALPIACKPYEIDGIPYFDGAWPILCPIGKRCRTAATGLWCC